MGNIIKRRHTVQYAQIHNNPLQNDLEDLRAIGLLSHLMSLPSDWVIYKTQLYKKFSRKNIDASWRELADKNYIIGFNCYINGKRKSFYNVSDVPFDYSEYFQFVLDTVIEQINSGTVVKSLSSMKDGNFEINEEFTNALKIHQPNLLNRWSTVPTVQYSQCSTIGTSNKNVSTNKKIKKEEEIIEFSTPIKNNLMRKTSPATCNKVLSDKDIFQINNKIAKAFENKINKRSLNSIIKKCINNYKKGTVPNYENYLITAFENKISELELYKIRKKTNSKVKQKVIRKELVPKWLQEEAEEKYTEFAAKKQYEDKTNIEEERRRLQELLEKYNKNNFPDN
ncbi:hypothetical protein Q4571_16875 [Bacillus thuringiensis]|nr:hypothetical protein [Bacillus thuringiensis]